MTKEDILSILFSQQEHYYLRLNYLNPHGIKLGQAEHIYQIDN